MVYTTKEFLKGMVKRMDLENRSIEELVGSLAWCSLSAKEFAAIEYELENRIERGDALAEDARKMIKEQEKASDEYERQLG